MGALVTFLLIANGQAICLTDDQCDDGYYCDDQLIACVKCISCNNFKQLEPCAKSVRDCGSGSNCLDGYKFNDGRCVPTSILPTVIATTVFALVLLVAVAVYVLRRKYVLDINPEMNAARLIRPTAPITDPEYQDMNLPPPAYNHHNLETSYSPPTYDETKPTVPLLHPDLIGDAGQPQRENMQRAIRWQPPSYGDYIFPSSAEPPGEEHQENQPPAHPNHNVNAGTQESVQQFVEQSRLTSELTQRTLEQTQALPEHTQTIPEHTQTIPEHNQTIPEHNQTIPEQTQAIPEQTQTRPEHAHTTSAQTPSTLQQPVHYIIVNVNNDNSANLLSIQRQEQYTI